MRFSQFREPLKFEGPCVKLKFRLARLPPRAPGHQAGHVNGIAAVEFQRVDLLAGDVALHGCRFGLQLCGAGRDFDGFRGGADGQSGIHREIGAGVELVVTGLKFLKAGGFRDQRVQAGREIGDGVIAGIVGRSGSVQDRSGW